MDHTMEREIKEILSEIRLLEDNIESKQRCGIDFIHLVDTVNRKTELLKILIKIEA
jgi:hypothetical protein